MANKINPNEISKELMAKAQACETPEELLKLAKENGIELSKEAAEAYLGAKWGIAVAPAGVATNVHYKPLPLLTAYRDLGFAIGDYPNAYAQFANEITLPLHTLLSDDDVAYVCEMLKEAIAEIRG